MTTFDDRKDRYEGKFAHDAALQFKAEARRNKKLAMWAADLMGYSAERAEAYVKEVIAADFEEAGDEDVFRKIRGDFDKAGIDQTDHQIRRHMDEFLAAAIEEIRTEG